MNWAVCNMHGPWYPPTFYKLVGDQLWYRSYNRPWSVETVDPEQITRQMAANPNAKCSG